MELYESSINDIHKMYQLKNEVIANKHNKQLNKQTKLDIISLAYTDSLTASDLLELASILTTISNMKPIKKERTINK